MRNSNVIDKMHCEGRSDAINIYSLAGADAERLHLAVQVRTVEP